MQTEFAQQIPALKSGASSSFSITKNPLATIAISVVIFAIIILFVAVILLSAGKYLAGSLFMLFGMFLCGGSFYVYRTNISSKK